MVAIKNVAVVGASGAVGASLLKAIVDSGKFTVTAISRSTSTTTFDPSVKVVKADYSSLSSLTSALKGQDAVVSVVGVEGLAGQTVLIDAAIAAGVKRILPSEFGSDLSDPKTAQLPVFGYKVAVRKHLEAKVAAGADITYTYVVNGGFLDWGLEHKFLLDWKSGSPKLYDGGNKEFSVTTLASVGQATVGVLTHYEETKNRQVNIQNLAISQQQLLAIAKKVAPEKKFEPVTVNLAELEKSANDSLAKGEITMSVMYSYIILSIFSDDYPSKFPKLDNELLGVTAGTDADVEAIFKDLFAGN